MLKTNETDLSLMMDNIDNKISQITKDEKDKKITLAEAKKYLADGEFEAGSMAPKVAAAINFLENGGKRTIITDASALDDIENGTQIIN